MLHAELLTVTGHSLADNVEGAPTYNSDVIRTLDDPLQSEGGLAILRGNLAPDGAVIKHSAANEAQVHLTYQGKGVHLEIADDGVGFEPLTLQSTKRPSWGLLGMQERTTLLGGTFEIISLPKTGTRVKVYIPYDGQSKGAEDEDSFDVS